MFVGTGVDGMGVIVVEILLVEVGITQGVTTEVTTTVTTKGFVGNDVGVKVLVLVADPTFKPFTCH